MRHYFLFLCLSMLALGTFAQEGISVGVRGGLNIPKLSAVGDNPMSKGYQSKLAGNGGIFAEIHFNDLFSVQPMIEYSKQGGKRDGMQAIPARMLPEELKQLQAGLGQDYLYADFNSKTEFDYLMIPILAKLGWKLGESSPFRVHVSAGPFVSFLMGAKQITNGKSYLYMDAGGDMTLDYVVNSVIGEQPMDVDRKIKDEMNSVNYGIAANLGFSYDLAPKHKIFIEAGGNYGLAVLQKEATNGKNRIGAMTVTLGYAYRLK